MESRKIGTGDWGLGTRDRCTNYDTASGMYPDISYRKPQSPVPSPQSLILLILLLLLCQPVFAQEEVDAQGMEAAVIEEEITATKTESVIQEPEPPQAENKLYPTFSWGATTTWLTRIIKQTGRSNFVFHDFMPGLYFGTELRNVKYIIPEIRAAVYYPLLCTFNEVPQKSTTPLHLAVDAFAGIRFETGWQFLHLSIGPGLHFLFLNADRWNYFNLGIAAAGGIEVSFNPEWSLLIDGMASFDNGNLGKNRTIEPFDYTWQYQTSIGARYSKNRRNEQAIFSGLKR